MTLSEEDSLLLNQAFAISLALCAVGIGASLWWGSFACFSSDVSWQCGLWFILAVICITAAIGVVLAWGLFQLVAERG